MKSKKNIIIGIIVIVFVGLIVGLVLMKKDTNSYLIELNKKELQEKIDNKDNFILVISREGCSHCAEYIPILKNVLEKDKVTAYIVDIAKFSKEDKTYLNSIANVSGTPTTLFIEKGEETTTMNRIVGSTTKRNIEKRLKAMGYLE